MNRLSQLKKFWSFFFQLDLILNLLGSPSVDEINTACEGAKSYLLSKTWRAAKVNALHSLSKNVTHDAIQLLLRMLTWDPRKRITINQALGLLNDWCDQSYLFLLEHPYIHEGRIRYHSCMCRCCFTTATGRQYTTPLEPVRGFRYDDSDEYFTNLSQGKGKRWMIIDLNQIKYDLFVFFLEYIHKLLMEFSQANTVPLRLNEDSPIYKTFAR